MTSSNSRDQDNNPENPAKRITEPQSPQQSSPNRRWLWKFLWLWGVLIGALLTAIAILIFRERMQLMQRNQELLARVLISESSIGNEVERQAVGLTVINRMKRMQTDKVSDVVQVNGFYHYAIDQDPLPHPEYAELAQKLLNGQISDFTEGATHFFSPYSMPKEGDNTANFDCDGGLVRYKTPRTSRQVRVCTPSWSRTLRYVNLQNRGIRPFFFEFYAE